MISAEQRARAQANRARALAIKKRKAEEAAAQAAPPVFLSTATSAGPSTSVSSTSSSISSKTKSSTPSSEQRPEGCVICDATPSMRRVDASILSDYGVRVCVVCKARDPLRWSQIVKTNAKKHYLVSDGVLSRLPHISKTNPRNPNFKPMMMFLRYHVEQAAIALYGSEEALEDERVERARKRALRAAKGHGQRKRRRKTLVKPQAEDMEAASSQQKFSLTPTGVFAEGGIQQSVKEGVRMKQHQLADERNWLKSGQHVHAFGPLTLDAVSGMHLKICACGFTRKFEVM